MGVKNRDDLALLSGLSRETDDLTRVVERRCTEWAALDTSTSIGDRQGRAASMRHLAGVLRAFEDENEAAGLLKVAIGIEAEIGGGGLASALEALAAVVSDRGRSALAATLFGGAQSIRSADGPLRRPDEIPGYDTDLADLRRDLGTPELECPPGPEACG